MHTGGPNDPKRGPKPIGEAIAGQNGLPEQDERREVVRDRYEKQTKSGEEQGLRQPASGKIGHRVLAAQIRTRTRRQLDKLAEEQDAVLLLLAESDFAPDAISRHDKKLDRIRAQLDDARHRDGVQDRADWELQAGLTELDESRLSLAEERLAGIADLSALLRLIAELGDSEGDTRRLVVRGADAGAAMEYAAITNPTTIFLDAPFLALGRFTPIEASDSGRTLAGQRALEAAAARW